MLGFSKELLQLVEDGFGDVEAFQVVKYDLELGVVVREPLKVESCHPELIALSDFDGHEKFPKVLNY